jgi:hypothetical protein
LQQKAENVKAAETGSVSNSERGVYVKQNKYIYTQIQNRHTIDNLGALSPTNPPLPMNLISIASNGELTAG